MFRAITLYIKLCAINVCSHQVSDLSVPFDAGSLERMSLIGVQGLVNLIPVVLLSIAWMYVRCKDVALHVCML